MLFTCNNKDLMYIYNYMNRLFLTFITSFLLLGLFGCKTGDTTFPEEDVTIVNEGELYIMGSHQFLLDGAGYVNGTFQPDYPDNFDVSPINYTGDWALRRCLPYRYKSVCYAITSTVGDRLDITATMTSLLFHLVGKNSFPSAGTVEFFVNNSSVGKHVIRDESTDSYLVTTGTNKECTVSMVLTEGSVCLNGVTLIIPNYPEKSIYNNGTAEPTP